MAATDATEAVARARDAIDRAVRELAAASARTETLAEYVPERRVLGVPRAPRAPRMIVIGDVWRLGVLLLDPVGRLYATGRVVRAERPARKSIIAESVAEHRAFRAAAVKGGIPEGATVVFDARPIELDAAALAEAAASATAPVVLATGADGAPQVAVRWDPAHVDAVIPFESYLAERVELLARPPQGA
ncbi:hypothetical protein [Agromyces sp. ZXT2-6]|uniref:hypothetical protein n=1 Tax=Agromyces sp. ZXT2-6 TaxID=3461153 RepID=UPI004054CEA8